jgi:hypothetical protein
VRELATSGLVVQADKGYKGARDHVRVPSKGRNKPASQKDANRAHARLRGQGERQAQLTSWRILQPPLLPLARRADGQSDPHPSGREIGG